MTQETSKPQEGDTYHCKHCNMSILVTASCTCDTNDGAFFSCCGTQLEKSESASNA